MAGGGIKISNIKVNGGADGATFIPSVSSDGVLSWTNNKGYTNPTRVNIKGKDGKDGKDGVNGANIVSTILQGQDANGGNIYKQTFSNGATANFTAPRGAMGKTGAKGDKGDSGNPQGNILQTTGTSTEDTMSQKAITEALETWPQKVDKFEVVYDKNNTNIAYGFPNGITSGQTLEAHDICEQIRNMDIVFVETNLGMAILHLQDINYGVNYVGASFTTTNGGNAAITAQLYIWLYGTNEVRYIKETAYDIKQDYTITPISLPITIYKIYGGKLL